MAPCSAVQTLRDSQRARRLITIVGGTFLGFLGLRAAAAKLLAAMLYHPTQYRELQDFPKMVKAQKQLFQEMSYQLDEVDYSFSAGRASLSQRAFLLHPKGPPSGGLWMVCGGNAMLGIDWFDFFANVLQANRKESPAILLVDYPGYGNNEGTASPRTVLLAQLALLEAALPKLAGPPGTLHLLGHSLGAAAVSQLATNLTIRAGSSCKLDAPSLALVPGRLVLSAPFLNIDSMAQAIFGPYLLPKWLLRILLTERWNNAAWVPEAAEAGWNVSIIHGSRDEIVPTWMGKALSQHVQGRGRECNFLEVPKAGHNNLLGKAMSQYFRLMGMRP